ncbi:MAG TPA: 2-oxoacid:acceptor oxidoreductase family protein [Candidatus Bathyarchaeia archaeon]|nr:2-oxoacid:acceptor oxidoreductase family protein [Candidatus Bathyarchaeia archaeon]
MTTRSYLIVGHGGQGVLDLGNFLCYDAILNGQRTAYTPSYGPETRGGKVRCYVVASDEEIDSPIVDHPDVLVAMNNPSMDFEGIVKHDGLLVMNTSLIDRKPSRQDLQIVRVPATDIADRMSNQVSELSDSRVLQNAVAYGSLLATLGVQFDESSVQLMLQHVYAGNKTRFIPANLLAVKNGYQFITDSQNIQQDAGETRSPTATSPRNG